MGSGTPRTIPTPEQVFGAKKIPTPDEILSPDLKKKEQIGASASVSASAGGTGLPVSELKSTEPKETSIDFLSKDIDESSPFSQLQKQTESSFGATVPDQDLVMQKDQFKQSVLSSPDNLKQYSADRQRELKKKNDELSQQREVVAPRTYNRAVMNLDAFTNLNNELNELNKYKTKLASNIADVAGQMVVSKELPDMKQLDAAKAKSIGRQVLSIADPELEQRFKDFELSGRTLPGIRQADIESMGLNAISSFIQNYPHSDGQEKLGELNEQLSDLQNSFAERNADLTAAKVREKLGAQIYKEKESAWFGFGYNEKLLKQIAENPETGLTPAEKKIFYESVLPLEKRLIGSDIPTSGFTRSLTNAVTKSVDNTNNTLAAIAGLRTDTEREYENFNSDILEQRFRAAGESPIGRAQLAQLKEKEKTIELSTDEKSVKKELENYVGVRDWWSKFKDVTGDVTGQVLEIAFLTKGIGAGGRALTIAGEGGGALGLTGGAIGTALSNEMTGLFLSSYLNSFDNYKKQSLELLPGKENGFARNMYANTMAIVEGLSERIFVDTKVFSAFTKELSPSVKDITQRLISGELTQRLAQNEFKNALSKSLKPFAKEFAKSELQESTEEAVVDIADELAQSIYGKRPFDVVKAGDNAVNSFVTTLIGSGLVSGLAAKGAARRARSQDAFLKSAIVNMAANPAQYLKAVEDLQLDGAITQVEANQKIKLIGSASKYLREMPQSGTKKIDGIEEPVRIDYPTTASYLTRRLHEGILQERIDNTTDPIIESNLKAELKASQEIRKGVLEGKIFVTPDMQEVVADPEEAEELGIKNVYEVSSDEMVGTDLQAEETKPLTVVDAVGKIVDYKGQIGELQNDDEGNYVVDLKDRQVIIPVANKTQPVESLDDLGVKVLNEDEQQINDRDSEQFGQVVSNNGNKFFVFLADPRNENETSDQVYLIDKKGKQKVVPGMQDNVKLGIINKFLQEKGLPARSGLTRPGKPTQSTKSNLKLDEAKETLKASVEAGKIKGVYAQLAESNPDYFLKFIADQVYGRTDTGEISPDAAEASVVSQFGQELVDLAAQAFPLTPQQKKAMAQTSNKEKYNSIEDFESELDNLFAANESGNKGGLPKLSGNKAAAQAMENKINSIASALSGIADFFKGNALGERAINFLSPIIQSNKNIKLDSSVRNFDTGEYNGQKINPQADGYSFPDGTIIINLDKIGGNPDVLYRTILHEMVHAATRAEITNSEAFRNELSGVLNGIRSNLKVPENGSLITALVAAGIIDENLYGTANEHEMLAEVFSNQRFYDMLAGMEYKGDNLLKRLFLEIAKFFSEKYKQLTGAKSEISADNIADYLIELTQSVVGQSNQSNDSIARSTVRNPGEPSGISVLLYNEMMEQIASAIESNKSSFLNAVRNAEKYLDENSSVPKYKVVEVLRQVITTDLPNYGRVDGELHSALYPDSYKEMPEDVKKRYKLAFRHKAQAIADYFRSLKVNDANGFDALPSIKGKSDNQVKQLVKRAIDSGIPPEQIRESLKNIAGLSDEQIDRLIESISSSKSNSNETKEANAGQAEGQLLEQAGEGAAANAAPPSGNAPSDNQETSDDGETGNRRFTQRVLNDETILPESKKGIEASLEYAVQTNVMSIQQANEFIDKVGVDEAFNAVVNSLDMKGAVRVVVGQTLIKKFNELAAKAPDQEAKNRYIDKTIDTANFVSEKLATEAGQIVQAFSLWSYLTPEGQLRAATKEVKEQGKKAKDKKRKSVNKVADRFKKANEETIDELTKSKKIKSKIQDTETSRIAKAKSKIERAKNRRNNLIKKFKSGGGKLYSGPGLAIEGIEFVGSLAATYIQEGIANVEIVVENIRQELVGISSKEPNEEVMRNVRDIVQDQVNKEVSRRKISGLKEMELDINQIVREYYTVADEKKTSLTNKLIDGLGLDKEDVAELAKEIQLEFDRIATSKKQKILEQEKKRFDRIQSGERKEVNRKELQDEMIRYTNLGAFENEDLLDMIADKLGLGALTIEEAAKIQQLATAIQKAPEGSPKNDATQALLAYRANLKGTNWMEIGQALWYASILSGPVTQAVNIVSNFLNFTFLVAEETARDPKSLPVLFAGGLLGFKRGIKEAAHTLTSGKSPIHISKVETPDVLERIRFAGGYANPFNWFRYVGRAMKAEDVVFFQGLKEMRAVQLAYREAKTMGSSNPFSRRTWDIINDKLLNTKERLDEAMEQAKDEGFTGREQKRRAYELMELSRPIQSTEDAYNFAAHGTFNHVPEGTLGVIAGGMSTMLDLQMGGARPFRFFVPFTRIITNVANTALDYSPVGIIRGIRGVRGFEGFDQGVIGRIAKGAYREMTPEERRQSIAKGALGIGLSVALYAFSKIPGDDGEPLIEITGRGTGDFKKDQQLRESGWQPFSIKIGGKYYSYKYTPMGITLSVFGNVDDKERYDPEPDETMLKRFTMATLASGQTIFDMTFLTGMANMLNIFSADKPERMGDAIGKEFKQAAGGILPNAYTQSAQVIEQLWDIPAKQVDDFFDKMLQDIPIARNSLNDRINMLGDPVAPDKTFVFVNEPADPILKFLSDKNLWVGKLSKATVMMVDKGIERPATDDEYYEVSKIRGKFIKEMVQDAMEHGIFEQDESGQEVSQPVRDMHRKRLEKWFTGIKSRARKVAERQAQAKILDGE